MDDFISREAAEKIIAEVINRGGTETEILTEIHYCPPADVAPVRHGQWIFKCDDQPISNDKVYGCSLCDDKNRRYYEWQLSNYCPNCGAKMDGGQDK